MHVQKVLLRTISNSTLKEIWYIAITFHQNLTKRSELKKIPTGGWVLHITA